MKPGRNIKLFINYFLGPLLFAWLSWSIYRQIRDQPNLELAWQRILELMGSSMIWNLVAALLLVVVNWSLEAVKWQVAVRSVQKVPFITALKAVLSGVSFSVSTPNRVGEYLGRVLYMKEGNRLRTIAVTIVASMSQLLITLLMGFAGVLVLRNDMEKSGMIAGLWIDVLLYGVGAALLILTLFYFRLSWLIRWVDRLPGSGRFAYLVRVLEDFDATILLRILSLSAIRYLVFIAQYYLLFKLFNVDISWWQAGWSVSVSLLVLAVIPSFAIADLGLRGEVAIKLIGLFSTNSLGIWMTTMVIWLINLILPAVAGSLLILSIRKIFANKHPVDSVKDSGAGSRSV